MAKTNTTGRGRSKRRAELADGAARRRNASEVSAVGAAVEAIADGLRAAHAKQEASIRAAEAPQRAKIAEQILARGLAGLPPIHRQALGTGPGAVEITTYVPKGVDAARILLEHANAEALERAVRQAAAKLVTTPELLEQRGSVLQLMGELVSRNIRRAVLRSLLFQTEWNLSKCGRLLGVHSVSNLLGLIRSLDLVDDYEKARGRGDVKVGAPSMKKRPRLKSGR